MNLPLIPNLSSLVVRPAPQTGQTRKLLKPLGNDDYLLELDNTSLSTFSECERKGRYTLIDSRIGLPSYALTYGAAVHAAIEEYYKQRFEKNQKPDLAKCLGKAEDLMFASPPPLGEWRTFDKLQNMFLSYVKKYELEDSFEILKVEETFAYPLTMIEVNDNVHYTKEQLLIDPNLSTPRGFFIKNLYISWTGKIDLILRQNSQLFILDHKTTSIEGPTFWASFDLSPQFRGYAWACQKLLNEEINGAIVNAIYGTAPAATPVTQKKHLDKQFIRQYYYYKQDSLDEWEKNTIQKVNQFVAELLKPEGFPMNENSCISKYGTCKYHDVCKLPRSARSTLLNSDQFTNNVWNPLD